MASTANTTLLSDLFDPQVVADEIDKKLIDYLRFAPLATIDTTLVGRDGDEITMPFYAYVGDATAVNEGADIPIAKLTQSTTKVKVAKIGRAIQFTDEALLSGNANSVATEASKQVLMAINSKIENDLLTAMQTATLTGAINTANNVAEELASALLPFGEDIDGEKVILVHPSLYVKFLKSGAWIPSTELGAEILIKGTLGSVMGCQVVISNRVPTTEAYIVKPGALRIAMKRDTLVEFDRDVIDQTNYIVGSKIFAPYIYDASKIIKVAVS